jgi:hypothetical protein
MQTTSDFPTLHRPDTDDGEQRRVGIEIECAGLNENQIADILRDALGGDIVVESDYVVHLRGSEIGDIKVELDTSLRRFGGTTATDAVLDAARAVVPAEIVTQPLTHDAMRRLDALCGTLRDAGARGTQDGALLGFGVHLNVAVIAPNDPFTLTTILAFGLIEDWLRRAAPIDTTRRAMPFVDPWPRSFVDALVNTPHATLAGQRRAYAEHVASRNHGLDLLPLFKSHDTNAFARDFPDMDSVKERPAFHFRMPDCRIDDPSWSLAHEWERWWLVEALAAQPDLVFELCTAWRRRDRPLVNDRRDWADIVSGLVGPDGAELRAA